jgi:hypothetical protein
MIEKQKSCAERVQDQYDNAMETLRILWKSYCKGEERHKEYGSLWEYGLSFDYVAPGTFEDQECGYFRYQLSWGGPSDEFRFYADHRHNVSCIEYWFLDWYDGASIELTGEDFQFMLELFGWFEDAGAVESVYNEAME